MKKKKSTWQTEPSNVTKCNKIFAELFDRKQIE